jgi:hypothetical protein
MFINESGMNHVYLNINGKSKFKNIDWNADYNGKNANIFLNSNDNGNEKKYKFMLNNDDLVKMLNIDTSGMSIDKRLNRDFKNMHLLDNTINDKPMIIEFPNYTPYEDTNIIKNSLNQQLHQEKQEEDIKKLQDLELYLPIIVKKRKTKRIPILKKRQTRISRRSLRKSSSIKPKSHKIYKIYKNSKSIGYLKHKKSSKKTL